MMEDVAVMKHNAEVRLSSDIYKNCKSINKANGEGESLLKNYLDILMLP